MKLPRIKRNFLSLSDAKLVSLGRSVIEGLTDNPLFPKAQEPLADFKTAFDEFFLAIPSRNDRSPLKSAIKNAKKDTAVNGIFLLSFFVAFEAKFDMEALESSNFELVNKRTSKGLVGLVKSIELKTNGVDGMVIVQCKADANATMYFARASTDGIDWKWTGGHQSRTVKITGLPKGEPLFFQMKLENSHGSSPWSDSVSGMIPSEAVITSIHE